MMYRRYAPNPNQRPNRIQPPPHPMPPPHHPPKTMPMHEQRCEPHNKEVKKEKKREQTRKNPIFGFVPTSVYNPETKKVLGMFSAEDLLLAGLIFLLLENEENNDPMLVYALLYILLSDYIDLPF